LGPSQSSTRVALGQLAEQQGLVLKPAFELAGTEAFITVDMSGMGVALVPRNVVLSREVSSSVAVLNVEGFPLRVGS
jgi:DNA-binding transcriptional LysR family regulator